MGSRSDEQTITSHTVCSTSPMVAPVAAPHFPDQGPKYPGSFSGCTTPPRSHYWSRPSTWRRRVCPSVTYPDSSSRRFPPNAARARLRSGHAARICQQCGAASPVHKSGDTVRRLPSCSPSAKAVSLWPVGGMPGFPGLRPKGRKVSAGITCSLEAADAVGIEPNFLGLPR